MKLLVVIDMQKDFITGALGNKECRAVVPNVVEKVNNAVKTDTDIAITLDTHNDNYLETQEEINLPVKHCIKHSYGWKLIPELQNGVKYIYGFAATKKEIFKEYIWFDRTC